MPSVMLSMVSLKDGPEVPALRGGYDPFSSPGRDYIWQDDANCQRADPELFMVNRMGDPEVAHIKSTQALRRYNESKIERAKEYCNDCPVMQECLDNSTPADLHWSVRAGLTPASVVGKRMKTSRGEIPSSDTTEYLEFICRSGRHRGDHHRGYKNGEEGAVQYCRSCEKASRDTI